MKPLQNLIAFLKKHADILSRGVLIAGVIAILFLAIDLSGTKTESDEALLATNSQIGTLPASSLQAIATLTPQPSTEYGETAGVIVGALAVVVVLLLGTFVEILTSKNKQRP
jgi:hypothetical protein